MLFRVFLHRNTKQVGASAADCTGLGKAKNELIAGNISPGRKMALLQQPTRKNARRRSANGAPAS
jgi:hypothetical protein